MDVGNKMQVLKNCDETRIAISLEVRDKLIELKKFPRETYDDVLRRALDIRERRRIGQKMVEEDEN